ncbi:uncharacterized protein LOC141912859 [Tubulanus polymorphus]|uniref:uncharacterized protein LOC141912859 n=1 Tax=Tubulanus polymorphus TaxID=672921 RepID=UPI003DA3A90B
MVDSLDEPSDFESDKIKKRGPTSWNNPINEMPELETPHKKQPKIKARPEKEMSAQQDPPFGSEVAVEERPSVRPKQRYLKNSEKYVRPVRASKPSVNKVKSKIDTGRNQSPSAERPPSRRPPLKRPPMLIGNNKSLSKSTTDLSRRPLYLSKNLKLSSSTSDIYTQTASTFQDKAIQASDEDIRSARGRIKYPTSKSVKFRASPSPTRRKHEPGQKCSCPINHSPPRKARPAPTKKCTCPHDHGPLNRQDSGTQCGDESSEEEPCGAWYDYATKPTKKLHPQNKVMQPIENRMNKKQYDSQDLDYGRAQSRLDNTEPFERPQSPLPPFDCDDSPDYLRETPSPQLNIEFPRRGKPSPIYETPEPGDDPKMSPLLKHHPRPAAIQEQGSKDESDGESPISEVECVAQRVIKKPVTDKDFFSRLKSEQANEKSPVSEDECVPKVTIRKSDKNVDELLSKLETKQLKCMDPSTYSSESSDDEKLTSTNKTPSDVTSSQLVDEHNVVPQQAPDKKLFPQVDDFFPKREEADPQKPTSQQFDPFDPFADPYSKQQSYNEQDPFDPFYVPPQPSKTISTPQNEQVFFIEVKDDKTCADKNPVIIEDAIIPKVKGRNKDNWFAELDNKTDEALVDNNQIMKPVPVYQGLEVDIGPTETRRVVQPDPYEVENVDDSIFHPDQTDNVQTLLFQPQKLTDAHNVPYRQEQQLNPGKNNLFHPQQTDPSHEDMLHPEFVETQVPAVKELQFNAGPNDSLFHPEEASPEKDNTMKRHDQYMETQLPVYQGLEVDIGPTRNNIFHPEQTDPKKDDILVPDQSEVAQMPVYQGIEVEIGPQRDNSPDTNDGTTDKTQLLPSPAPNSNDPNNEMDGPVIAKVIQDHSRNDQRVPGAVADIEISIDFDDEKRVKSTNNERPESVTVDHNLKTVTAENVPHIDITVEHIGNTPVDSEDDRYLPVRNEIPDYTNEVQQQERNSPIPPVRAVVRPNSTGTNQQTTEPDVTNRQPLVDPFWGHPDVVPMTSKNEEVMFDTAAPVDSTFRFEATQPMELQPVGSIRDRISLFENTKKLTSPSNANHRPIVESTNGIKDKMSMFENKKIYLPDTYRSEEMLPTTTQQRNNRRRFSSGSSVHSSDTDTDAPDRSPSPVRPNSAPLLDKPNHGGSYRNGGADDDGSSDDERGTWHAVFKPKKESRKSKSPSPRATRARSPVYASTAYMNVDNTSTGNFKPLEFQLDLKPIIPIDRETGRRSPITIDPANRDARSRNSLGSDTDHLSDDDKDLVHFSNSNHNDKTPEDEKLADYYIKSPTPPEGSQNPSFFPKIYRHPAHDSSSDSSAASVSSPSGSLRGRLWMDKNKPPGARSQRALRLSMQNVKYPSEEEVAEMEAKKVAKEPPKVKEKSQYTKTEPEKKDIDKVVEKGASEKPEKKKFVIEEQEYQPPKRENFKETMENNSKESSKALPVQIQNENGDCDEEPLVLMPISERMQLYQKLTSLAQSPTIHHIDKPVQWTVAALDESDSANSENMCCVCNKRVYALERLTANKNTYHKDCFKCTKCRRKLLPNEYYVAPTGQEPNPEAGDFSVNEGKLFCKPHFMELFRLRGHYEDRYKGKENIPQQQNSTIVVNNQRLKGGYFFMKGRDGEPDENEEITKEDDKQDDGIDTVPNLKNIRSMFESGQDQNTNEKVRAPSAKMRTGWTPSDNTVERSPSPERDPSIIRNEKQDPEHKNVKFDGLLSQVKSQWEESVKQAAEKPVSSYVPLQKIEYEDATERSPSPDIPRDPNVVRSDSIVEENMPPKDLAKGLVARFRQMESEQVHTAPPMPTRSPKLHARNQQQQQPAKPTGPPEPRMDLIDQARRASDVRTEWAMENAPEGGEFENNPEQRPDVIRESDPNQTEVLPEIGTTKSRLAIFKEIEQTGGVPSPQVGDSYKKRSPPPMKEIPASADHNGELESQPVVRTDVVRESDQFDDGLPPPQMARNIRDMFQNMGSQEQKKEEKRQTTNKQYGSPTVPKRYGGSVNSPVVAQSASQRYAQPPGSPNLIPKSPSSYRSGAVGSTPPKSPATTIRQPVLKKPESPKPFVYESRSQYKEFTPPRESPARNITSKEVLENEPEQHKPEVIRCDELWDDSEELPPPDLTRGMLAKFREMEQKHKDEREKSPVTVRRPRGEWGTTVTYKKGEPQAPVNGTDQLDMSPEGGEYENNPEVRSDVIREADTNDVDVMPQSGTTRSLLAKFQA